MKVAEVMHKALKTISADATVADAVAALAEAQVSALPVLDRMGRAMGVLSAREVLKAERARKSPRARDRLFDETLVREIMAPWPVTIAPDADVRDAAREMLYLEVQRLFVEHAGPLLGVISQTDIVGAVATQKVWGGGSDRTRQPRARGSLQQAGGDAAGRASAHRAAAVMAEYEEVGAFLAHHLQHFPHGISLAYDGVDYAPAAVAGREGGVLGPGRRTHAGEHGLFHTQGAHRGVEQPTDEKGRPDNVPRIGTAVDRGEHAPHRQWPAGQEQARHPGPAHSPLDSAVVMAKVHCGRLATEHEEIGPP